eukprot:NODE_457_length_8231_cov_0.314068.p1 type:complete len:908 gc:universal NODE_457_length_8231_cov_0.314068:6519-3796(-)
MEVFLAGIVLRSIDTLGKTILALQDIKRVNGNLEECSPIHKRISSICYMLESMKNLKTSYATNDTLNELLDVLGRLNTFLFELKDKNLFTKAVLFTHYKEALNDYNQQLDSVILKLNACHIMELKLDNIDIKLKLDNILVHISNNNISTIPTSDLIEINRMQSTLNRLNPVNLQDLSKTKNIILANTAPLPIQYLNNVEIDINMKCGTGSFGTVYLGKLNSIAVAIKVFHNMPFEDPKQSTISTDSVELSKMVLRELKAFEQLQHCPYVARFYGATSVASHLAVVVDYIDNHSLSHWLYIDTENQLNNKLHGITLGIALGLEYLHLHGMAHNDIKSANIMLDHLWEPKLIDFGMVQLNNMSTMSNNTVSHMGTAQWRAPEYWNLTSESRKQRKQYMSAGDVFSFSIVLGELTTKEMPWDKCGKDEIKEAILNELRPYEFHGPIFDLMTKCWSQLPQDRIKISECVEIIKLLDSSSFSTIIHKEMNNDSAFGDSLEYLPSIQKIATLDLSGVRITECTDELDTFIGFYKNKKVVIKKYNPIYKVQAYQITHLNLCTYIGSSSDMILFDFVGNGSMAYWLYYQNEYKFSVDEKIIILRDISSALSYLHDNNLSHGGLNPTNIMFTHDLMVKLTDYFYTCTEVKDPVKGYESALYMEKDYKQYDIYCFSLVCGEIFTNSPPFESYKKNDSYDGIAYSSTDVPLEIRNILIDGLARNSGITMRKIYEQLNNIVKNKYHVEVDIVLSNDALNEAYITEKSASKEHLSKSQELLIQGKTFERNKDYKSAYEKYRQSADLSCPEAQYNLANLYSKGLGSKKKMNEAIYWFTQSAKLGNVDAMYALGTLYKYGGYIKYPNKALAREWYQKASDLNHVESMYQLAKLSDKSTRTVLLERCAELNHEKSIKRLAAMK